MKPERRTVRWFLAVSLALVFPGAARAQAPTPAVADTTSLDELLVELRVGRLASRTVMALTDGSRFLLPAADLLEMGEVEHAVLDDGTVRAVLHPGERVIVLEAAAGRATLDGLTLDFPAASLARTEGTTFVATEVLEAAFGLGIRTDWVQLTATVTDPEALPLGRRLRREAGWANLTGDLRGDRGRLLDLQQTPLGGAVLDWRISSNVDDLPGTTAYAVGAGARAFGGGLQVSAMSLGPAEQGQHKVDATYQRVFQDLGWLTQVRVGDGFVTGPRFRSVRGVSLTNAPFVRRGFFGVDAFSGRVSPGWDVELRQANQTLDVTRADEQGAFALDIPLRYGENAVQVVAFGPHGEVVTADRILLLGSDRLTQGTFEWGLSGGACRDERCQATGNVDLRYGISNAWTARGGLEVFGRDTLPSLQQPYIGVSGAVLPSLLLSAEGVHDGFLRGGLTYAPSPRLRARVAHTAFSTSTPSPVLHDASRERTTEADLLLRPLASSPRWLMRASAVRQEFDFGTLSRMQVSSTILVGRTSYEAGLRREVDQVSAGAQLSRDYQFAAVSGLVPMPVGRKVWARVDLELLDAARVDRVGARLAYQVSQAIRAELGGGWRRGLGAEVALTFSADFAQLRSLTQLVASEGAPTRVSQVSQGAMHWNEATGSFGFSQGPGLERGGVSGYVFVDENGNGVRDVGETGVDGVRVVIGGRTVRSDALGRHGTWDLVPFEPVEVWADSASIDDPFLVPVRDRVTVVVPPSSFGRVDIPLTLSKELTGRVVQVTEAGEMPVPYAQLELVDLESGSVRSVRAFSDGAIYEMGVKPGRYELRVAPAWVQTRRLRLEATSVPLEIEAGSGFGAPAPVLVRLVPAEGDGSR